MVIGAFGLKAIDAIQKECESESVINFPVGNCMYIRIDICDGLVWKRLQGFIIAGFP